MITSKLLLCSHTGSRGVLFLQSSSVLWHICLWERRTKCFVFLSTRICMDIRHLHSKPINTSIGNCYRPKDEKNDYRSLVDGLMVSLFNGIQDHSQQTETWNRIKKSFESNNKELSSYVRYFNIVLSLSRDEKVASRLIDFLVEIGGVEVEMGVLLKDLLVTGFDKLMLRSIEEKNMVRCRRLFKIIIAQGHLLQAVKWFDIMTASKLELRSENDLVLLKGMILNLMEKFLICGITDEYIELRRKFLGKIRSENVHRLLFRLLENEQITLEVYLWLMQNEHYVLSNKEGRYLEARCKRNPTMECESKVVSRYRGICNVCGEKLKKDPITEHEFKLVLEDYFVKLSDLSVEKNVCTMYFDQLQSFIQTRGPFHYFLDIANMMSGNDPAFKQICQIVQTLPPEKRVCVITDNWLGTEDLPENVSHFKVDRFIFRPQDDLLILMGILENGPDTVLISNDSYQTIIGLLRDDTREIMHKWQRVNQLPFYWNAQGSITLYPKLFSRSTQTSSLGWHIPFHTDDVPELDVSILCIQKK